MSREQQVRDALARFLAAVRQATDAHLETLSTELMAIVRTEEQDGADAPARLVAAVRRIDEATTLSGVLDGLAAAVAEQAPRTGVLLVDRAVARPYRQQGFPDDRLPCEVAAAESAAVARAIASQGVALSGPGDDPKAPPFLKVPDGHLAVMMSIVVAQQVVAIVHAEGEAPGGASEQPPPAWVAFVELLARHGSTRLENVTSKRTVEALGSH